MSRHLVFDCDPGCDDALALLLVLSEGAYDSFDLLTVAGNVGVEQVTQNARRIVAFARLHGLCERSDRETGFPEIRIFKGSQRSLRGERPGAASVHGRDGMGDVPLQIWAGDWRVDDLFDSERFPELESLDAASHLRSFRGDDDRGIERDLVCTGPLTNLASALLQMSDREQHRFWSSWKRVVIMAGAIGRPGNISYAAEFNAHADPDALEIVLRSSTEAQRAGALTHPPILVPLDLTERLLLWVPAHMQKAPAFLNLEAPQRAILCMLRKYFLFHAIQYPPPLPPKVLLGKGPVRPRDWSRLDEGADRRNWDSQVQRRFRSSRRRGGGGLKELPRWCFVHDPTALWIVCRTTRDQEAADAFDEIQVHVDTSRYGSRGHLLRAEPRQTFFASSSARHLSRGDLSAVKVPKLSELTALLRTALLPRLGNLLGIGPGKGQSR